MRAIDADALIGYLHTQFFFESRDRSRVYNAIQAQPTIEPERKKGKWIDEGFYADGHGHHAYRCSECGGHIIEYEPDNYCKYCGSDMREGE